MLVSQFISQNGTVFELVCACCALAWSLSLNSIPSRNKEAILLQTKQMIQQQAVEIYKYYRQEMVQLPYWPYKQCLLWDTVEQPPYKNPSLSH